ncbi:MAG: prenyltransferase/squalene oxidase repeat-containing protein, partial [Planctomycetota bacterium]
SRAPAASEKGTSMLDLGPTKISPEFASERRGGGGLPEISLNAAESTRSPSGRTSSFAPQIAAAELQFEFQSLSELQTLGQIGKPSDEQMELARNSTPSKPTQKSKSSDSIESSSLTSSAKITASSGRRAQSKPSEIEANFKQDRASEGNSKSRIAQAPRVDNHPEFGKTGAEDFSSDSQASNPDESVASQLVQRATASIGGSGVLGKATQVMAGSMTGMPLFSNGREGKGKSKRRANESISIGESDNRSRKEATRTGKMAKPNVSNLDHLKNSPTAVTEISKLRDAQPGLGELSKSSTKKLTGNPMDIEIESDLGVGGLGQVASRRVGKRSDVIRDSQNFTPDSNVRFRRKEFGGRPTISPTANLAKEAFSKRNPASLGDSGPQTEAAIELGLEFLVNCQLADGSWTLRQFDTENPLYQNVMNSDTAATGLALLAFQGAGYNHKEFKYANQVKNGIDWLVEHQDSNGGLYVESDQKSNDACRMYSHAIAALALAEAYGMTQDPELQRPAQKALDYISNTQDTRKGGWRYFADPSRRSSDTSVTGWMMMALKSGQLAGLQAPGHTLQKIDTWLGVALVPNSAGQFRYNPYAVDSDGKLRTHGRKASTPMTSVGLLMRVYTGWGPKDPRFLQGAQTLLNQLPSETNSRSRDTYYWYYATQVMKHAGGDYWERWRERLHPLLIGTQQTSGPMRGSWDPFNPVPDRWGPQGGRIYVTTMNLLSLEVKYRLLPLYENTFK